MSDSVIIKDNAVVRSKNERVMVYIDLNNVFRGARDRYPLYMVYPDYERMVERLVGNGVKVGVYVFDGIRADRFDPSEDLHEDLKNMKFEVCLRVGTTESRYNCHGVPYNVNVQKGVDGALMTQLLTDCYKDNFDTAIIVSADRDFNDAAIAVRREGKNVECATFDTECQFMHVCNSYCDLDCLNVVELYTKTEYRRVSLDTKDDGCIPETEEEPLLEEVSEGLDDDEEEQSDCYTTCNNEEAAKEAD